MTIFYFTVKMEDVWCRDEARFNKPSRLAWLLNPRIGKQHLYVKAIKPLEVIVKNE
jgi:hypothetical protein